MRGPTPLPQNSRPTVHVVATTLAGTRAALQEAIPLAGETSSRVVLLVPQVVPFPIDLHHPADPISCFAERYRQVVASIDGDVQIEVCVCRRIEDVAMVVDRADRVVIGGRTGRWLATSEERLADRLARVVGRVIFVTSTGDGREAPHA